MGYIAAPCVGSGMCCKKGPCAFGESISKDKPQCKFLEIKEVVDSVEVYKCGKIDEIVDQPFADINPAFGAGCCMSLFNDNRKKILALIHAGRMKLPHCSPRS